MRYVPRLPRRWRTRTLVGVVILAMATVASGGVAQASDDWTTGHTSFRYTTCRSPKNTLQDIGPSGVVDAGYTIIDICYRARTTGPGYDVDVRGLAVDQYPDGECITARIRYQVYINGAWSGWQYRNMATACPYPDTEISTIWWSRYPTQSVQAAACFRDTATSTVSNNDCSDWT